MGRRTKIAIGLILAGFLSTGPARADSVRVPFRFDWNGIPLGTATMVYNDTDATYDASLEGKSNGFGNLFSPLTTTTSATGRFKGDRPAPSSYDTTYQLRVKRKEAHLRWDGAGKLTEERLIPPRTEQETRPAVPAEKKIGAIDPLSGFWSLRKWAGSAQPGATHTLKVWDGKRLYDLVATYDRQTSWRLSGPALPAHFVRVKRVGLAGFKPEEQAALEAGNEPELHFYFAAGDAGPVKDLDPVGMEIHAVLGTIHAVRTLPVAAPVAPVESRTFQ